MASVYGMDVTVFEGEEVMYQQSFYFTTAFARNQAAVRVRPLRGAVVKYFHHREHSPVVVKRMVKNREKSAWGEG